MYDAKRMEHTICRPTPTSNHHSDDSARGLSGVVAHVCARQPLGLTIQKISDSAVSPNDVHCSLRARCTNKVQDLGLAEPSSSVMTEFK